MADGLETLRANPLIGANRVHLNPDLRAFRIQRHVVYYRIQDDAIEIVRILHERVDPARHLLP